MPRSYYVDLGTARCPRTDADRRATRQARNDRVQHQLGHRLQYPAPPLVAEIPHPRGLCRQSHRNGRSAAQPRPAPPIVRCSTRATWRTKSRDSNRPLDENSAAGHCEVVLGRVLTNARSGPHHGVSGYPGTINSDGFCDAAATSREDHRSPRSDPAGQRRRLGRGHLQSEM